MKKKKIIWVSDFESYGGAEESEKELLKRIPEHIEVEKVTGGNLNTFKCDLFVLNNFRLLSPDQIQKIIESRKYVMYWRDVIDSPNDKFVYELFKNAKFNVFLSYLHQKEFFKKFDIIGGKYYYIAPYFETSKYSNPEWGARKKDICWIGNIQHHKGIEECLLWARDNERLIDFYGKGNEQLINQISQSKYAQYCGHMKNIKVIYPQYKYFIHFPDKIETFGRACMEAYLSGCKFIGNQQKIGMYYHSVALVQKDPNDIQRFFSKQVKMFWKSIDNAL